MIRLTTVAQLRGRGFLSLCASRALHGVGVQVRYWMNPHTKEVEITYRKSYRPGVMNNSSPLTWTDLGELLACARTYEEQCEIHRELGLPVVPPGHEFMNLTKSGEHQGSLF